MALFICGFFSGIAAVIAYILYVTHKQRQRLQEAIRSFKAASDAFKTILCAINEKYSLSVQLRAAEEREDYEEAARIRDILNKK